MESPNTDEGWEYSRRRTPKAIRRELLELIVQQDWCECELCQLVREIST